MEKSMKKKIIYITMLLLLLAGAGGCKGETNEGLLLTEPTEENGTGEAPIDGDGEQADAKEAGMIYVQVSGAVEHPGVYELQAGSRIFHAVALAGGVTKDAEVGSLNQAELLSDGQMVYILRAGEAECQASQAQQEDGRVNLNTATKEELATLPGIGEAKAKGILAWREANGGFRQIEDLMEVEGIKDGIFSKIKDSVKVN